MLKFKDLPPEEDEKRGKSTDEDVDDIESSHEDLIQDMFSGLADEEKPVFLERRLQRSEISPNLCMLGKITDGHGYTYLKAKLTGLGLTELSAITSFQHLQHLDVSNNFLTLEALQTIAELPFLVSIRADKNMLDSAALKRMKYLQVIIMNTNVIHSIEDVYQPELSTLELGENKITRLSFKEKMPTLRCLDLRFNVIEDIKELDMVINLDSLYLAGNKITRLELIHPLVNLRILHVRNNPIKQLTFNENLIKLHYVNLRACKMMSLVQVKKLRMLKALRTLVLTGCPCMGGLGEERQEAIEEEDDTDLRAAVLASLPRITRLNKTVVSKEERDQANETMKTWFEEGEDNDEEMEEILGETENGYVE